MAEQQKQNLIETWLYQQTKMQSAWNKKGSADISVNGSIALSVEINV